MKYEHLIRRLKLGEPVSSRDIREAVADAGVDLEGFLEDLSDPWCEPGSPASGDPCECGDGTAIIGSSRRNEFDVVTRRFFCSACGRFIGQTRLEGWRVPSRERGS